VQPDQIPQYIMAIETDLYTAKNRVMKIHRETLVGYNSNDCSLNTVRQDTAVLGSMNGVCNINLTANTASGICDESVHVSAPPLTDLMALQENASAVTKARRPQKTGDTKLIAGVQCDVYKSSAPLDETYCISKAGSFLASPIHSFGGTIPGLRLEIRSENGKNQTATEVQLDRSISPEIFAVPKDVKVKSRVGVVPLPGTNRMPGVSQ
jgi:hypothetical protein